MQKPSIPKGTRDFTPQVMVKRDYIFNVIKGVYKKYGYSPIETPAMENLSTLLGKYGEEGDRLLFRILNSGDFLGKLGREDLETKNSLKFATGISEKGLRYDLTVPFARFVVQNRNEIAFPFKRYQIQPVWRADRPQKGRYREFFQCDADVVGSDSLLNEVELLQIVEEVFTTLNIDVTVKINNRKILTGIAEVIGQQDKIIDITTAIDKIEKIGLEKVINELKQRGLNKKAIEQLIPFLTMKSENSGLTGNLKSLLKDSKTGINGIEELEIILNLTESVTSNLQLDFNLTLARGLNYYTGAIIEVKANDADIGSICGGGRYDNLTGIFGLPGVSGVGISFGADRIFDVMEQKKLFPTGVSAAATLLIINFGEKERSTCLQIAKEVRKAGIPAEYYPDPVKVKKQMNYANAKQIPYVLLAGEEEIKINRYTLKNMETGNQVKLPLPEIIKKLS
ncbi:MAG: histidine--tRNA ligase [Bacteroidales bacterium]|jgi:histidyl-tRNA synthetase